VGFWWSSLKEGSELMTQPFCLQWLVNSASYEWLLSGVMEAGGTEAALSIAGDTRRYGACRYGFGEKIIESG